MSILEENRMAELIQLGWRQPLLVWPAMKEDLGTLHIVFVEFNRFRIIDPKPEAENA